jgi:hypothetical protein
VKLAVDMLSEVLTVSKCNTACEAIILLAILIPFF